MANLKIIYTNNQEEKEYCYEREFRIKDNMLIVSKGRYEPSKYINLAHVKSFELET